MATSNGFSAYNMQWYTGTTIFLRVDMLKLVLSLVLLITCVNISFADIDYTKLSPPVEFRGIWIDAGGIPNTINGVRELVQNYAKLNINVLMPEVIARGYTVYPSKLLARDPRFTGTPDLLCAMIDEAHKLGMEVHPWVWVFRAGYTKDRGAILNAHPDWVELSKYGEDLSANGGLWISPANPAARDFLASLFAELVRDYDVDGIHLDYIRYEVQSPTPYGYSEVSRNAFFQQYGIDPIDIDRLSMNQYQWYSFRERQINTFIQSIALQTRKLKPNAKISAAVGSDPKVARLSLCQNWVNWVENKWVDFVTPMAYSASDETFRTLVSSQKQAVDNKTILAPGIGLHLQKKDPSQTIRQIGITRELLANGQTLFSTSHFGDTQQTAFIQPYSTYAALPYRTPRLKAEQIAKYAKCLTDQGKTDEASYFQIVAANLCDYATYQEATVRYVPPTEPPLNIPAYVIPLPEACVQKTTGAINIDGSLDEDVWLSAARVELSYTNQGAAVPIRTTSLLTYDDTNIYIAFESYEPSISKVKTGVDKRDGPTFYDDSVEIFVDSTDKRREYYHLSTNTLGTQFDQKVFNPGWNGEWKTASKLGDGVWYTEIAIPFNTLGAKSPAVGDRWALNLTRNRTTSGVVEYINWAVPYGSFHSPDRFGTIVFN